MSEALPTYNQMTFGAMSSATSLRASAAGPTPSDSQDGPKTDRAGREVAPASPSAWQEVERARLTNGTYGQSFNGSSPSADLQRSLESRLRVRMAAYGSPEYVLTWKHWDMHVGLPILAQRASARRTSGSGSTGWPTPNAGPQNDNDSKWQERRAKLKTQHKNGNGFGLTLGMAASLAGWATPKAKDGREWGPNASPQSASGHGLGAQSQAFGTTTSTFPSETSSRGALNPALSLWLQGYPSSWLMAAPVKGPRVLRSSRA